MIEIDNFFQQQEDNKIYKLGTIDKNYSTGLPRIMFDGETVISNKGYSCLGSYQPLAGDRVLMLKIADTYVILDKIKNKSEQFVLNGTDDIGSNSSNSQNSSITTIGVDGQDTTIKGNGLKFNNSNGKVEATGELSLKGSTINFNNATMTNIKLPTSTPSAVKDASNGYDIEFYQYGGYLYFRTYGINWTKLQKI